MKKQKYTKMRIQTEWLQTSTFLVVLSLLLSLSSCNNDIINSENLLPPIPEGYIRTTLNMNVAPNKEVNTRATASDEQAYDVNNIWVLVFDENAPMPTAKLKQKPAKATVSGSGTSQKFHALLKSTGEARKIYVLTGLSSTMNTYLNSITDAQVEAGSTTWTSLNQGLITEEVTGAGIKINKSASQYIPMCSQVIDRSTAPNKGTTTLPEILANFERIVAKIDVKCIEMAGVLENVMPTSKFMITGFTLWNGAKQGYVLPQVAIANNLGGTQKYNEATSVLNNAIQSQVYLYENSYTSPTTIIIKGRYAGSLTDNYYRLDILNTQQPAPSRNALSIERNTHYIVKILKVETIGYRTPEEAYNNGPSNNIDYNIVVTDPTAQNIVSNGQYYLGVSNTNFILYSSNEQTSITIAEITHNAPSSVNQGSVTFNSVLGTAPTLLSTHFTSLNGSTKKENLTLKLPANLLRCIVVLRLGNLKQEIVIERRKDMLSFGGYIPLGTGYAYGSVPTSNTWTKLSNRATDNIDHGSDEIDCAPSQEVYMILRDNISTDPGATNRKCEFFLAGGQESGRTRFFVEQPTFDIISQGGESVFLDTYVGTFHRHDQRGERLIKMNSSNTNYWLAQVVIGKDFIRLDSSGVPDTAPYPSDAENSPVNTENVRISGLSAIKFRVGLTSTIPADQVRYGLITVTHAGGVNRIFVRQGEKADYVMRPEDPIMVSASITKRPDAKRISPFNLTDPSKSTTLVNLSGNKGVFVNYPSQAGYFFQAHTPYAWPPDRNAVSFNTNTNEVVGYDAICPSGYRRIKDGVVINPGLVEGSEMRQSLWYYPKNGMANSDYENSIRGLLADGFFDRQNTSEATTHGRKTSMVNSGFDRAYIGVLIFNPINYASIFMPAAGSLLQGDGRLDKPGLNTIWWSSSKSNSYNGGYWFGSMEFWGAFTFDNYSTSPIQGASLRCVVN